MSKADVTLDYVDVDALATTLLLSGGLLYPDFVRCVTDADCNGDLMLRLVEDLAKKEIAAGRRDTRRIECLTAWLRTYSIWTRTRDRAAPSVVPEPQPLAERVGAWLDERRLVDWDAAAIARELGATEAEVEDILNAMAREGAK